MSSTSPASGEASPASGAKNTVVSGAASSNGESSSSTLLTHPQQLINLEVKVLTQALGAENQWVERGDGRVEFLDFTIRVVAAPANGTKRGKSVGSGGGGGDASNSSDTVDDEDFEDNVILEDIINSDTPFVGENCCIVWNSFDQQLSMCLMYASEEGYAASWSALVALQDKAYPPFRFDLLERCTEEGAAAVAAAAAAAEAADGENPLPAPPAPTSPATVLPYSYFIHSKYDPPLGFIEQHALSLSIMEGNHMNHASLFSDSDTVMALFTIANGDLIEALMGRSSFEQIVRCMKRRLPSNVTVAPEPKEWGVPDGLARLQVPEDLSTLITKDQRLTYLHEHLLAPLTAPPEVTLKVKVISHRLRNEITCALLANDALLRQAREGLLAAPPSGPNHRNPSSEASTSSLSSESVGVAAANAAGGSRRDNAAGVNGGLTAKQAEQQVLAHLHFFRSLVCLSMAELGRELVGPIVAKMFLEDLLEALSLVAERYTLPANLTAMFASNLQAGTSPRRQSGNTVQQPLYYSAAIEQELSLFLDVTLVRLNERQGELLMTETIRAPILANPIAYNGFMTFLVRQMITPVSFAPTAASGPPPSASTNTATGSSRFPFREGLLRRNPYLLYHVLGLHDDEGAAAAERAMDPENNAIRTRFHNFVITKYLAVAARGNITTLPQPPTGNNSSQRGIDKSGGGVKMSPLIHFQSGIAGGSNPNNGSFALHNINGLGGTSGAASGSSNNLTNFASGISPFFIRTLTYLIRLTNTENREVLLRAIFHHKSAIMNYVARCFDLAATRDRSVGTEVLGTMVRFLREILQQTAPPSSAEVDEPTALMGFPTLSPPEPLPRSTITFLCRQLTLEHNVLGRMLQAFRHLGGRRHDSTFHSAVLALLDFIARSTTVKEDVQQGENTLRDVRDHLFFSHLDVIPDVFARRFREQMLRDTVARLGQEPASMSSQSALSSTFFSEGMRSTTKLRFVDEVEAASGGVDGTVLPTAVPNLSPSVVASLHSSEEKNNNAFKKARLSRSLNAENWSAAVGNAANSTNPNGGGGTTKSGEPAAPSQQQQQQQRPPRRNSTGDAGKAATGSSAGGSDDQNGRAASAGANGSAPATGSSGNATVLRPTAPKNERPVSRPRQDQHSGNNTNGPSGSSGNAASNGATSSSGTGPSGGQAGSNANASGGNGPSKPSPRNSNDANGPTLPKIKKRS